AREPQSGAAFWLISTPCNQRRANIFAVRGPLCAGAALVLCMSMHYHSPLATHFGGRSMTAMIIDASGVRPAADALEVGRQVATDRFFWLDISGGDPSAHHALLTEAGLNAADAAWALRFGQAGRMHIGGGGLRTATWIADRAGNVIE